MYTAGGFTKNSDSPGGVGGIPRNMSRQICLNGKVLEQYLHNRSSTELQRKYKLNILQNQNLKFAKRLEELKPTVPQVQTSAREFSHHLKVRSNLSRFASLNQNKQLQSFNLTERNHQSQLISRLIAQTSVKVPESLTLTRGLRKSQQNENIQDILRAKSSTQDPLAYPGSVMQVKLPEISRFKKVEQQSISTAQRSASDIENKNSTKTNNNNDLGDVEKYGQ